MKRIVVYALVSLMAAPSAGARERQEPPEALRTFANQLRAGAFVSVRLKSGARLKGHVIEVAADALRVKPKTRVPVPIRDLAFADIASIERAKEGKSPAVKTLIGVGIGVGIVYLVAFLEFVTCHCD